MEDFWKQLVKRTCDQKFEEAAECRMYDEMTSNQINNAGSTDAFPIAQTWAIDFVQKRAKELGGG